MKKYVLVGGTFDNGIGMPSSIVSKMAQELPDYECINGGSIDTLNNLDLNDTEVLVWMPNIDNLEDKILPNIKKKYSRLFLVSSKRVVEKVYTDFDVVSRLLKSHSNLGIIISKNEEDSQYNFRLLDPLGNEFSDTTNIFVFCKQLKERIETLKQGKRVQSKQITIENLNTDETLSMIKDEFIDLVKRYGNAFTEHVNAVNPNRFLGNASTRCMRGFPAYKANSFVYFVSRRNVDKETLSKNDFVAVSNNENIVQYVGDNKPSVDAPIQIRLFNYYHKVKYMIHGHVYIEDALFTKHKIPCGYIEEFNDITELYPDKKSSNFTINLKGHGCLIMANDLSYLESQLTKLKSRPLPEIE